MAPSGVSGERGLLGRGGVAVLDFDLFEGADGLDVVEGFFAKAALSDTLSARYGLPPNLPAVISRVG
jgi:hypothetical protein